MQWIRFTNDGKVQKKKKKGGEEEEEKQNKAKDSFLKYNTI